MPSRHPLTTPQIETVGRAASRLAGTRTAATTPICFSCHGLPVGVIVDVPDLAAVATSRLAHARTPDAGDKAAVEGIVTAYRETEVLRHVCGDAVRVESPDPTIELYRDRGGERFWVVDERWGLCEINLLKRSWRSWVLDEPSLDATRVFEASVLWPLAQIARGSGTHLLPAAAVARDGRGVLIVAPFDVSPELAALADRGVRTLGRRWVSLRTGPDERPWLSAALGGGPSAACELVLLVEPMRRATASAMPMSAAAGREQLKRAWPIPQLSAAAGPNVLAAKLARSCPVHRVRLSQNGGDLARMLVAAATPRARVAA